MAEYLVLPMIRILWLILIVFLVPTALRAQRRYAISDTALRSAMRRNGLLIRDSLDSEVMIKLYKERVKYQAKNRVSLSTGVYLVNTTITNWDGLKYLDSILSPPPYAVKISLTFDNCRIPPLDRWPRHIDNIRLSNTPIERLSNLPDSLHSLYVYKCGLGVVDAFPKSLEDIVIIDNKVRYLPKLPPHVTRLDVKGNKLHGIPTLPPTVERLNYFGNPISKWRLPKSWKDCRCDAPWQNCLPFAARSINILSGEDRARGELERIDTVKRIKFWHNINSYDERSGESTDKSKYRIYEWQDGSLLSFGQQSVISKVLHPLKTDNTKSFELQRVVVEVSHDTIVTALDYDQLKRVLDDLKQQALIFRVENESFCIDVDLSRLRECVQKFKIRETCGIRIWNFESESNSVTIYNAKDSARFFIKPYLYDLPFTDDSTCVESAQTVVESIYMYRLAILLWPKSDYSEDIERLKAFTKWLQRSTIARR